MIALQHIRLLKLEEYNEQEILQTNDFYKIALVHALNNYAPALLFSNPNHPHATHFDYRSKGFICLFSSSFFTDALNDKLNTLPLFINSGKSCRLSLEEDQQASSIFIKMLHAIHSDYLYKEDLLRNYISELLHIAMKSAGINSIQNTVSLK